MDSMLELGDGRRILLESIAESDISFGRTDNSLRTFLLNATVGQKLRIEIPGAPGTFVHLEVSRVGPA